MRIEQLTFTRFIASIGIVIFHFGSDCPLFYNGFTDFIFEKANIGVSYFFILSGFVMIIAYNNNPKINTLEYLKNRFSRIYPVYFLSIFLILILSKNINFQELFLVVLMIQVWVPGKAMTINPAAWTLSVEIFFYILFPFLFNFIYKKSKLKTISIYILVFWLLSQIIYQLMIFPKFFQEIPFLRLNEFLMGNLAGIYFVNTKNLPKNYNWQILLVFFVFILTLKFPMGLFLYNGLLAVIFIPLIVLLSLNVGVLTNIFSSRICVFLGEISFGIYILQFPVWMWLSDYRLKKYFQIDKIDDFSLAFFIRLFALIMISSLSYKYFETPIRKKIKKYQTAKLIIIGQNQ